MQDSVDSILRYKDPKPPFAEDRASPIRSDTSNCLRGKYNLVDFTVGNLELFNWVKASFLKRALSLQTARDRLVYPPADIPASIENLRSHFKLPATKTSSECRS